MIQQYICPVQYVCYNMLGVVGAVLGHLQTLSLLCKSAGLTSGDASYSVLSNELFQLAPVLRGWYRPAAGAQLTGLNSPSAVASWRAR